MSDDYNKVVDDLEDVLDQATKQAQPKAAALIERLNDTDVEWLRNKANETYNNRRGAIEAPDKEFRQRVAGMSRTEFEQELSKLK